ncbi:MAG: hypothetical protein IJA85_08605 [Clostridia bacterium]|nr:hypothetical protein [Clostridia bacterium]
MLDQRFVFADAEGAVDLAAEDICRKRVEVEFNVIVVDHHFVKVETQQLAVHLNIAREVHSAGVFVCQLHHHFGDHLRL